jgi:hypothetical protein
MHPPDVRPDLRDEIVVGVGADDLALRVMLRDELGTAPARQTQDIYRTLLG